MHLPYRKIFKQAYEIVRNNKFLWIFGLFLLWGNVFNASYFSRSNNNEAAVPVVLPEYFQSHPWAANLGLLAILGLIFLLYLLFFQARAGMIAAVKEILDKRATSFWLSFKAGKFFSWRLLGISILIQLGLFVLLLVILVPVLYLFSVHLYIRAITLAVFGLIIFVPVSIVTSLVTALSPNFIVLNDLTIKEAASRSFELIAEYWVTLIIFGLILFGIMLLALFLSLFIAGLVASPFVLLTYLAYHRGGSALSLGLMITTISLGSIVFLTLQAMVAVFQQTAWVLAFLELVKPQKLEEEEPLPVPEVIS